MPGVMLTMKNVIATPRFGLQRAIKRWLKSHRHTDWLALQHAIAR